MCITSLPTCFVTSLDSMIKSSLSLFERSSFHCFDSSLNSMKKTSERIEYPYLTFNVLYLVKYYYSLSAVAVMLETGLMIDGVTYGMIVVRFG